MHAVDEAFPTWWTSLPMRQPVLTGWAGGPAGLRLADKSEQQVLNAATGNLAKLFGMSAARVRKRLIAHHVTDWQSDAFARGAYSYVPMEGLDAVKKLKRPVEGTLFFAGEHTHEGMSGTVARPYSRRSKNSS